MQAFDGLTSKMVQTFDLQPEYSFSEQEKAMGIEIERKFLVRDSSWRALARGVSYRQGYLSHEKERTVRVRAAGGKGVITIKGITTGATRAEFEYEIPLADAEYMLSTLCEKPVIEKTRYKISFGGQIWEVDEFSGDNQGLIFAEVELSSEDQQLELPAWVGDEVTSDPRYYNANLVRNPFKNWK